MIATGLPFLYHINQIRNKPTATKPSKDVLPSLKNVAIGCSLS